MWRCCCSGFFADGAGRAGAQVRQDDRRRGVHVQHPRVPDRRHVDRHLPRAGRVPARHGPGVSVDSHHDGLGAGPGVHADFRHQPPARAGAGFQDGQDGVHPVAGDPVGHQVARDRRHRARCPGLDHGGHRGRRDRRLPDHRLQPGPGPGVQRAGEQPGGWPAGGRPRQCADVLVRDDRSERAGHAGLGAGHDGGDLDHAGRHAVAAVHLLSAVSADGQHVLVVGEIPAGHDGVAGGVGTAVGRAAEDDDVLRRLGAGGVLHQRCPG